MIAMSIILLFLSLEQKIVNKNFPHVKPKEGEVGNNIPIFDDIIKTANVQTVFQTIGQREENLDSN